MGFFKDFFGGGGSESGPVQLPKYFPEQEKLLKLLVGRANEGLAEPAPTSPDAYVPMTPGELSIQGLTPQFEAYSRGETPYKVGDEYVTKFMDAYRPVWERARNEALDLARGEYAGPTYWGTARANRLSELGSEWGEKYAMTEAELRLKQDEARRAAIDKYIGVGTEGLGQVAGMERNVAEQRTMDKLNKFLRGEEVDGKYDPLYNQNIQLSLALLGISPYTYGERSESEGPGLGYGILTGLAQGMGSSMG